MSTKSCPAEGADELGGSSSVTRAGAEEGPACERSSSSTPPTTTRNTAAAASASLSLEDVASTTAWHRARRRVTRGNARVTTSRRLRDDHVKPRPRCARRHPPPERL